MNPRQQRPKVRFADSRARIAASGGDPGNAGRHTHATSAASADLPADAHNPRRIGPSRARRPRPSLQFGGDGGERQERARARPEAYTAPAAARPAARPEKMHPPRKVPSSAR